ncbi:MAG: HtaA domain-containing protein [Patulibacter sp.]
MAITSGSGLDWGLKESWRRYIGAQGTTLSDGATRNADGTFHFPVASGSYDATTKQTELQLAGTVVFLGHCEPVPFVRPCLLDMTLSDPRIEISEERASLYATIASRPITGGEVTASEEIELASLDVEEIDPAIADGTTSWSGLPALLTPKGAEVFSYPPNTVLDLVSFAYEGPGGKPAGETWTPAGTPVYDSRPLGTERGLMTLRPATSANELIGVHDGGTGGLTILDRATLARKGRAGNALLSPASVAMDPVSGTIFAAGGMNYGRIHTYTWDGTTLTGGPLTVPGENNRTVAGSGVWDARGNRYLVARYSTLTFADPDLWEVVRVDGAWTPRRIGPIVGLSGRPLDGFISSLALVQDGGATAPRRLIATRSTGGQPIQLYIDGARAVAEPLPEAAGTEAVTLRVSNGGIYLIGAAGKVWFMPTPNLWGTVKMEAPGAPVTIPGSIPDTERTTVDPATDTLYVTARQGTQLARIEAGQLRHLFPLPDVPLISYGTQLAGVVDGRVVLGAWTQNATTPSSYGYVARSPEFTQQPADATVALTSGASTTDATFTIAVAGDPAPTVRWQSRTPGQGGWQEIAGETGLQLRVDVDAADTGRQFRAVLSNAAGELASSAARLDVQTPPTTVLEPAPITVAEGSDAVLEVLPAGNPYPEIQWQHRVGGVWANIEDATAGRLVLEDATADLSGAVFRARLRNDVGTSYSRTVAVTVAARIAGPVSVVGGYLDWGVKQSFRRYIAGPIAHGTTVVDGGVTINADGTFRFPVVSGVHDAGAGTTVRLGGSVSFSGHVDAYGAGTGPALTLRIADPRVVIGGSGSRLVADVTSKPNQPGASATEYPGVTIAELSAGSPSVVDGAAGWNGVAAKLTGDGVAPFAGFYEAGTDLDPLTLRAVLGGPVVVGPEDPDDGGSQPVVPVPVPVVLGPAPLLPAPPVAPARVAKRSPAVTRRTGRLRVGRSRTVTVATVTCPDGPCRIAASKRTNVRIGGRTYRATVLAPTRLASGRRGSVRIRLSSAATRRLRGHTVSARVRVAVSSPGRRVVVVSVPRIRG